MFELVHAFATGTENTTSIQALFNRLKPEPISLNAGRNYFDVGPWFDEVGDSDNYKFQDCSAIFAQSKGRYQYLSKIII